MRITTKAKTVSIDGVPLRLRRTTGGVIELWARDDIELAAALGFAHAHDRMVQMMLVRLIGRGRAAECLHADEQTTRIDVFMREMGFARDADRDIRHATPEALAFAESYARGVNAYLENHRRPLELKLVGYKPEPWTPADTLLNIHLLSYVGLAQAQQDMEKLIVQAIQEGVHVARLKQLFAPHLDALDDALIDLIRRVRLARPMLPPEVRFLAALPSLTGSNNWVLGPGRSLSGFPVQCDDPHLECNRLPAVWYECVMHTEDDFRIGMGMPGIPGMVMGRTRNVSFGLTYGFMDMIDYFIEDVRGGKFRSSPSPSPPARDGTAERSERAGQGEGGRYEHFTVRREIIRRKKDTPIEITVFENDRGILETRAGEQGRSGAETDNIAAPSSLLAPLPDGLYLCHAYTARTPGQLARSLEALYEMAAAKNVEQVRAALRKVSISGNWGFADRDGNIGFQQTGLLPARKHSGLYPVPAWTGEYDWDGLVPAENLISYLNPPEGYVASANHDVVPPASRSREQAACRTPAWHTPPAINLSMGNDRYDRIVELLESKARHSTDDMKRIQTDLYSKHAERYMAHLRPLIPDTPVGRILADWDLRYDRESRGATLFEAFYEELLREVFGGGLFGQHAWHAITSETSLVAYYFQYFDKCLLGADQSWFGSEGREAAFRRILANVLAGKSAAEVQPWGRQRRVMMTNIFFGGRLPRLFRVDRGPVTYEGGRATVVQSAIVRTHGRLSSAYPSYRLVTDLGRDDAETCLAGGPSDRPFSKHYVTDVERWMKDEYKKLRG